MLKGFGRLRVRPTGVWQRGILELITLSDSEDREGVLLCRRDSQDRAREQAQTRSEVLGRPFAKMPLHAVS